MTYDTKYILDIVTGKLAELEAQRPALTKEWERDQNFGRILALCEMQGRLEVMVAHENRNSI